MAFKAATTPRLVAEASGRGGTRKDDILLRVKGFLGDSKFLSKAVQVISLKKVMRL